MDTPLPPDHESDVRRRFDEQRLVLLRLAHEQTLLANSERLLEQIQHTEALQRLRAIAFDQEQARMLDVEAGDPGLFIERRGYLEDGRAVEMTHSYYRGDAYDFVAELNALA